VETVRRACRREQPAVDGRDVAHGHRQLTPRQQTTERSRPRPGGAAIVPAPGVNTPASAARRFTSARTRSQSTSRQRRAARRRAHQGRASPGGPPGAWTLQTSAPTTPGRTAGEIAGDQWHAAQRIAALDGENRRLHAGVRATSATAADASTGPRLAARLAPSTPWQLTSWLCGLAAIVATRPFSVHKRVAWTGGSETLPRLGRASTPRRGREHRGGASAADAAEDHSRGAEDPPRAREDRHRCPQVRWLPDLRDACSQRRRSAAADGVMCRLRRPSRAEGVHGGAVPVVEHGSHGPPKRPLGSAPRDPCPPVERRLLRTNVLRVPDEGRLGMWATCCQRSPSASGALF
jgi:hypothetical protein